MAFTEYNHVVLRLLFLKYISDAFKMTHAGLEAQRAERADLENPDEYRAVRILWASRLRAN